MASNAALARVGRDRLCEALGIPPPAPDSMLGSMAAVPLPDVAPTVASAQQLQAALLDEDRVEVPVLVFPVKAATEAGGGPAQALVRISAQRYNRPEEYQWLAERLATRVRAARSPRSLLGRLRRG
jgi:isopenicillin-N epimerase